MMRVDTTKEEIMIETPNKAYGVKVRNCAGTTIYAIGGKQATKAEAVDAAKRRFRWFAVDPDPNMIVLLEEEDMKQIEAYYVGHHTEEFDCEQCGWAVYVGDTAYLRDGIVACSPACVLALEAAAEDYDEAPFVPFINISK